MTWDAAFEVVRAVAFVTWVTLACAVVFWCTRWLVWWCMNRRLDALKAQYRERFGHEWER